MIAQIRPLRPSSSPPPRSPEREALAAAIAALAAIEAELGDVQAAAGRLQDDQFIFWRAVEDAEQALEQARADEPRRLVDEALGRKTTVLTVDAATAALGVAERRVADGRRARELVRGEIERIEVSRGYAITRVDRAVAAVIREAAEPAALVAEHYRLLHRLHTIDAAIAALPVDARPPGFTYFLRPHHAPAALPDADLALAGAWHAAVDALARDPDAPLPPAPDPIRRVERVITDPPPAA